MLDFLALAADKSGGIFARAALPAMAVADFCFIEEYDNAPNIVGWPSLYLMVFQQHGDKVQFDAIKRCS